MERSTEQRNTELRPAARPSIEFERSVFALPGYFEGMCIMEKGLTFCRPEIRTALHKLGNRPGKSSPKYCPICNFRIRGKNHEQGQQHKAAVRAQSKS